jgi:uncharacterized repeat protein (TIGR03803 family)
MFCMILAARRVAPAVFLSTCAFVLPAAAASDLILYSFPTQQAGEPMGRLLLRHGTLFGTTSFCCAQAYGTVFELKGPNETTLAGFNGTDGAYPRAGLIADARGALYGTSVYGGTLGDGTVFKVYKSGGAWMVQTIWSFGSYYGDGELPQSDLVMDSTGAIYGTTAGGGNNDEGSVFELTQSGGVWSEKLLYSFFGNDDGEEPAAGVLRDKKGDLYGTTWQGGQGICKYNGCGTVYRLTQSRGAWKEELIHVFGFGTGTRDGAYPTSMLIPDSAGVLYGTTQGGGSHGDGTVFRLSDSGRAWRLETLYDFQGGNDGANPSAGLVWGPGGLLCGTTTYGGSYDAGTVFALAPSGNAWSETVVHTFGDSGDGSTPFSAVIVDSKGMLLGTTFYGGTAGFGTVFQIAP